MKKETKTVQVPDVKVLTVATVAELQAICDSPLYAEFKISGQIIKVPCKRLSAEIQAQVREIKRVTPQWNPQRKAYDYEDPAFLRKVDEAEGIARSVTIYWGCPPVSAGKPGLQSHHEIHKYVNSLWAENVLQIVDLTIRGSGMEVVERTNFTSTGGLET